VSRYELAPGSRLDGPVLVVERESTTVVSRDARLEVDPFGNLIVVHHA
jgi:N-methylhydantoinase A/oxoprolinase/acetone carboxylase beta subunit